MPSLQKILAATLSLLLFSSTAHAHFQVQYPPTVGVFDEDKEGSAPCGGYTPDISQLNTTDFHVGGDSVVTKLTHPQANWLYRITITNGTIPATGANWTEIYPLVKQDGAGVFCLPQVTVPPEFVGQKAFLSIVASALDGLLYQCAAVHFVEGTGTKPSECTNGTVTGSFTNDSALTPLVGDSVAASSESPTSTPNAGVSTMPPAFKGNLGALLTTTLMVFLGVALMVS
ncbi:hypothetical protein F4779DRAFT_620145 [Xylariaceae sp. FL0662B]|nr:hypothetical protein F4779DRAFT_620145 [Xylariaceae sp. FL0662B]